LTTGICQTSDFQECTIEQDNLQWNTNKRTFPLPNNVK
ncbi:hypothetical protein T07_14214, partial [Trichinella nelsoni]